MVGGREIAVIVRTFGEINVFSIFFLRHLMVENQHFDFFTTFGY